MEYYLHPNMVKKVPYAELRFFFCTHARLYDLQTRRPTLWGRPPRWQLLSSIKFTGTHLYTWVERGTVRVKYLAQKHNPRPGLEPGPPDPEMSALTMRPLCLSQSL